MNPAIPISEEDYLEPCCPLVSPSPITPIPIRRVIDRLDEYLNRNDYDAACRHLAYWSAEADAGLDANGKLTVLNEQIGLYRKIGNESEGLRCIREALALSEKTETEGTLALGTTLLNAATGYNAFGQPEKALPLYQKAKKIYESILPKDDKRLAGLYNNMALAWMNLEHFSEAKSLFWRSVDILNRTHGGEAELAVTYCNLADLTATELGTEAGESTINEYLSLAESYLNSDTLPRDGYYAFVCEKCAPTFGHYGFFLTEQVLSERAKEIYERS